MTYDELENWQSVQYRMDEEGFEVRLEHPIVDGERQGFANIKEFSIIHLHRTQIDI